MASLKAIQKKIPGAATVAGRVIAYVNGKHYDLGSFHGDDGVSLSQDGLALMNPQPAAPELKGKPPAAASSLKGLDLDLEV